MLQLKLGAGLSRSLFSSWLSATELRGKNRLFFCDRDVQGQI